MRKIKNNKKGFSLIEAILSGSIFLLLTTAITGPIIYAQTSSTLSGERIRASFLASEGLEAVRNIRDQNFSNLSAGTFGLGVSANQWQLTGSSDSTGIFTRQIQIASINASTFQITSNVTWQQNIQRTGNVSLTSYLTNWQSASTPPTQAQNLVVNTTNMVVSPTDNTRIVGITISNSGTSNISIASMTLSWTGVAGSTRSNNIRINNTSVWTGTGSNGGVLNITDFTLAPSGSYAINWLDFNRNITGINLSITFTMTDGSVKSVTNLNP